MLSFSYIALEKEPSPRRQTITLEWSASGKSLAYSKKDNSLKLVILDPITQKVNSVQELSSAYMKPISTISFNPKDESQFVTTAHDSYIQFWRTNGEKISMARRVDINETGPRGHTCFMAKYSLDGDHMAVCSTNGTLNIYRDVDGRSILMSTIQPKAKVFEFAWGEDQLFVAEAGGLVEIYTLDSEKSTVELQKTLVVAGSDVTSIMWTKECFAVGCKDSMVQILDCKDLITVKCFEEDCDEAVGMVDVCGDDLLITYESTAPATIFNKDDEKKVGTIEKCQSGALMAIAKFNPANSNIVAFINKSGGTELAVPWQRGLDAGEKERPPERRGERQRRDGRRGGRFGDRWGRRDGKRRSEDSHRDSPRRGWGQQSKRSKLR